MENTAVDIGTEACDDESDNFSDIDDLEERQLARAAEAKNSTPAQTAAEAVHQMLTKKEAPDVSKKRKFDLYLDNDDIMPHHSEELESDAYKG
ncbi:hypothetical protein ACLB2K_068670 [Fragaria x ananassa]